MKYWLVAAAALLGVEAAAVACSCMTTDDPAELRKLAAETAPDALALVEVETVTSFQQSKGAGDRMTIVRTLAGTAAGTFRVERGDFPSGASCDLLFEQGQKGLVILFPSARAPEGEAIYRISGLCTAHLLERPVFRDAVAAQIRARAGGERG